MDHPLSIQFLSFHAVFSKILAVAVLGGGGRVSAWRGLPRGGCLPRGCLPKGGLSAQGGVC